MGKQKIRKPILFLAGCICLAVLFVGTVCTAGCKMSEHTENKVRDLEFTITAPDEIPEELQKIIAQKEKEVFRLTYSSGSDLYIAAGYGEQNAGGYSISVPELYLTDNSIVIKTELIGPEKEEQTANHVSYPYIVVKTEWADYPVVFQ